MQPGYAGVTGISHVSAHHKLSQPRGPAMQDFDDLHLSADDWDELHDPRPEECDFDRVMAAALSRRGFLSGLVAVGSGAAAMGRGAVLPGAAEAAERIGNSPDGMAFDSTGHLWIQTDGSDSNEGDFAGMGNNQMLVGGPARDVRRHPASRRAVPGWRGAAAALVHRGRDPQGWRSGGVSHAGPGTAVPLLRCGYGWGGPGKAPRVVAARPGFTFGRSLLSMLQLHSAPVRPGADLHCTVHECTQCGTLRAFVCGA